MTPANSDIAECDPFFVLPAEVGFHKSGPDQKDFSDIHDFMEANKFHFNNFTSSPKRLAMNSDQASQGLERETLPG